MNHSDQKYSNKDPLQICKDLGIKHKPKTIKQDMIDLIPASDASIPACSVCGIIGHNKLNKKFHPECKFVGEQKPAPDADKSYEDQNASPVLVPIDTKFHEDLIKQNNDAEDINYLIRLNCQLMLEIAAEITSILTVKQEQLKQCKWTDGESNTDTDFSELACKCAEEAWIIVKQKHQLNAIEMTATIPDIICTFSKNGKSIKVLKNKIELKSSKSLVMPGSTIGKLDINQPLIYCHRPKNTDTPYEIKYGQYHTGMGESDSDLFQDRTPRPQLNFTKLFPSSKMDVIYSNKKNDAWIEHYGKCAVYRLKQNVSYSWQDSLTKSILYEATKNIETLEEFNKFRESLRPT